MHRLQAANPSFCARGESAESQSSRTERRASSSLPDVREGRSRASEAGGAAWRLLTEAAGARPVVGRCPGFSCPGLDCSGARPSPLAWQLASYPFRSQSVAWHHAARILTNDRLDHDIIDHHHRPLGFAPPCEAVLTGTAAAHKRAVTSWLVGRRRGRTVVRGTELRSKCACGYGRVGQTLPVVLAAVGNCAQGVVGLCRCGPSTEPSRWNHDERF